ncbi:MAG: C39 family peptidase [Elusimicrobia bacterium]|nr:C39 family peptidase [Elusimicrobiota bacterium]
MILSLTALHLASAAERSGLVVHSAPVQFRSAKLKGVRAVEFSEGLFTLGKGKQGSVESDALSALYPFQELVASANADLPPKTGFSVEVQVRFVEGDWSRWFVMGRFSAEGGESQSGPTALEGEEQGRVDVDTLKLKKPADVFRYRLTLTRGDSKSKKGPVLRLVAVTYTDTSSTKTAADFGLDRRVADRRVPMDLEVPLRSQMTEQAEYAKDICSPTSVGMVLSYWKKKVSTADAVRGAYDGAEKIYGNWFLNTAYAGLQGMEAYAVRLNSMEELEAEVRAGRPTVISLAFEPGELKGAPIKKTKGHLLVVRGFDKKGDVIVNDPAAPKASKVRRVYRRNEFAKAWLGHKAGLAYRVTPLWPKEMVVGVPFAHLRKEPKPLSNRNPSRDHFQESQLLYGERVSVLEAQKDWAKVQATEQEHWNQKSGWGPYTGWVKVSDLLPLDPLHSINAVVQDKFAEVRVVSAEKKEKPKVFKISVGTRLRVLEAAEGSEGESQILLPGFMRGDIFSQSLGQVREETALSARHLILTTARLFLGDSYFWGGRVAASVAGGQGGVDCSGLVNLSYRVAGMDVPRNAQDQYLKSKRLKREYVKEGDLVFLSEKGSPDKIKHVMIYAGQGNILEASGESNIVREIAFEERMGRAWDQVEEEKILEGRTIYFGTFF